MKALTFLLVLLLSINSAYASCKTQKVVYYPTVVYTAPVAYKVVYKTCPCRGTWGSPSCNCPDVYVQQSGCSSCQAPQRHQVPGHWNGTEYEVFYDTPNSFNNPYAEDYAYTLDQ